jgi:hypothetical protein
LAARCGDPQVPGFRQSSAAALEPLQRAWGIEISRSTDPFLELPTAVDIDLILDVGANVGQFALGLGAGLSRRHFLVSNRSLSLISNSPTRRRTNEPRKRARSPRSSEMPERKRTLREGGPSIGSRHRLRCRESKRS